MTRAEAHRLGASDRQILDRISAGRWRRLHRHVFLVHPAPLSLEARALAATVACGPGSVAGGVTALKLLGIVDRTNADTVEVVARKRRRLQQVRVHVDPELPERSRISANKVPIAPLHLTIYFAARSLGGARLGAALDEARKRGLKMHRLEETIRRLGGPGSKGTASLNEQVALRAKHGIRDSSLESLFIPHLLKVGLTPRLQFRIIESGRCLRRGDFVFPEVKIDAETDGYDHEAHLQQWKKDREVDRKLMQAGWLVPRFTYWDVAERPREAASDLAKLVRRRREEFGLD